MSKEKAHYTQTEQDYGVAKSTAIYSTALESSGTKNLNQTNNYLFSLFPWCRVSAISQMRLLGQTGFFFTKCIYMKSWDRYVLRYSCK